MKKFFSFVIAACALFLFYSCEKQEQINDSSNFNGTLVFSSAKPEMADESGTRTVWTGSSVQWKAGDKIRVGFTLDGEWQSGIEGDSSPRLFASNDLKENKDIAEFSIPTVTSGNTSFQADYIQSLEGDLVFYGLYPSSCTSSATQTNAPEISITVPADQKPAAESFDPSADILIGKTQTLDATPTDPVLMDWSRIVALADITLKELNVEDGESLLRLTLTAQEGADLVGDHSLNLEDLTVSSPNGTTNKIILNVSSLAISSDNTLEVWVGLLPATITSLTVVLETNAATYTRTISGFSKTFVKNKRNLLGIKMTGATRVAKTNVNLYELLETSNVTLNKVEGGNGSDAEVNGNTAIKVGTSSKGGKMSVTVPAGSTKLHLHAAAWKDVTGLSLNISGPTIDPTSIALTADNGVTGNSPFTLSGSVDDYYYVINLSGITAETEITFTSSSNKRFVVWGVNVEPEPAVVNTPTLTFNNPTTTVNVGETVTNTAAIDPSGLTVTYSSGDESVATVEATTGEVTGVAAGTATITATFAGNDNYSEVSSSYVITVVDPNAVGNDGSLAHPYTVSEVIAYMDESESNRGPVYIQGKVSSVYAAYDQAHGTGIFYISDDGETTGSQFEAYSVKFLGNNAWVNGNTQIAVGDDVIVYGGELTIFNSSIYETKSGSGSYLYSLNGNTSETVPTITKTDITGVAAAGVSGATTTVSFANNDGWTASVTPDGTIVTNASLSGTTITYSVAANTNDARTGSITVTLSKSGRTDAIATISVAQLAGNGNTSETVSFTGSSSGGMTTVVGEQTGSKNNVTVKITNGVVSGD